MSHANAALTPRARLRLARLIVEDGWTLRRRRPRCSWSRPRTARKWADRYRAEGRPGWSTGQLRPHPARPRPARAWSRADRAAAVASPARPGPDRRPARVCRPRPCTRCWCAAGSTGSRHIDRVTGEPLRRYEHPHPGSLIHVDVTKFGNIPDGGGHRFVGRQQGDRNRAATARTAPANAQALQAAARHRLPAHRHR